MTANVPINTTSAINIAAMTHRHGILNFPDTRRAIDAGRG
jgi:hypothetical protein